MLDGLLGRGFAAKCKSLIKTTRARIEVVKRRAEAKQRFLKEDLVKLLANGLDINAFGRTEEFLAGSNLLASYDFIDQTCEYITGQLSCMQKQRECPEECREAVGSLMFAAARFSDLPELRDLRDVFQERYGKSVDCYVHQKFLEKLSTKPPETERKVQLLQDIASEYSLKWDSRGFEQRMSTPSPTPSPTAQPQPNKRGSSHATANKYNLHTSNDSAPKIDKRDLSTKERPDLVNGSDRTTFRREDNTPKTDRRDVLINQKPELVNGGDKIRNGKEGSSSRRKESDIHLQSIGRVEATNDSHKPTSNRERSTPIGDKNGILFNGKQEVTVEKYRVNYERDDNRLKAVRSGSSSHRENSENINTHGLNSIGKGESQNDLAHEKFEATPSSRKISGKRQDVLTPRDHVSERSTQKMQEEEAEKLQSNQNRAFPLPPPYVKSKDSFLPPPYTKPRDSNHGSSKGSKHAHSDHDGPSMEPSPRNVEVGRSKHERTISEPALVNDFGHEEILYNQDNMIPLPKPRSIRRKHHKSSSSSHQNEVGVVEDVRSTRKSSSSRRRDHPKKGLQILFDDERHKKDDEEKMIDKLLLHYSKKPVEYDIGNLGKKSHNHAGESSRDRSREGRGGESEDIAPPTRSISLPNEQSVPPADVKFYARANSLQPDNPGRHVHPKLPDYDDLAARFASLKGR